MIIRLFTILTIFSLITRTAIAQTPTLEEKAKYIGYLDSARASFYLQALRAIEEYQITEAIPALERNIWRQEAYGQLCFLQTMWNLHSQNTLAFTRAFIDTTDTFRFKSTSSFTDSLRAKVDATEILLDLGDYSTVHYVFDLLKRDSISSYSNAVRLLKSIVLKVPAYTNTARAELIRIARNDSDEDIRWLAISCLTQLYSSQVNDVLLQITTNDPDTDIRISVLRKLIALGYPEIKNLLYDRLFKESSTYRDLIADTLLLRFGSPQDYKVVKEYLAWELDPINKQWISYRLSIFTPPIPSLSITVMALIDSLISYRNQSVEYNWLGDLSFVNELNGCLATAKNDFNAGNQINCVRQIRAFQQAIDKEFRDSTNATPAFVTIEGWKFLYYNAQYILDRLPQIPIDGCNVKLINSTGTKLTGGTLQYYDGSWKDAVNNNDGTFFVNTTKTTLSLRMTYEYGTQTKSNVAVGSDTVSFQTVNAQIQLQNSGGNLIDTGTVQYYAGAWRNLGTTINGIASKELLPANYSFRLTYEYASKDKQQDLSANPTVVFQTVNATVQLQNSQGTLIPAPSGDQGTVQYYSGAWRSLGTTSNGVATKDLLPNTYSFRMTYEYASKDKQQDLNTNPTVVFQTVKAAVQLQNSQGTLIDQGTVQYYSGAWRTFGTTNNGIATKDLLPNTYSFRMTYEYASKDKQQDLNTNPTVVFQTVNAQVQLKNSQGTLIDQGTVQYYSGAWRSLGTTTNGIATKDLLPNTYSFRMTYEYASIDKQQDITTNNIVGFSTVLCTIRAKNLQNELIDGATVSYYSGAWRLIGLTVNGEITKELLPLNLSFRAKYGTKQNDKQQNLSTNNIVEFVIP